MKKTGLQAVAMVSVFIVGLCGTNAAVAGQRTKVPAICAFRGFLMDAGVGKFIGGTTTFAYIFYESTGMFTNGRIAFDYLAPNLCLPYMPPFLLPGATFELVNFRPEDSDVQSTAGPGDGVNLLTKQLSQFQRVATTLANDSGVAVACNLIYNSVLFFVFFAACKNDLSALEVPTLDEPISPTEFVTNVSIV